MANDGKDLQRLIRIIESARAAGTNIKIESPKFFADKVTGKQREHDVVLTITHDHHELVVALECRDRSRPVGVDAVEAFHTKCNDTGINSGVIVSSKGFHNTARTKAQHYGIRCLTLDEVDGFNWFKPTDLNVFSVELIQARLFVAFESMLDVQISDLLNSEGEPLTNEAINATACSFIDANRSNLPRDLGKHEVHVDIVPGFSTVIDGVTQHTTRVVMTIEYENRITKAPFQLRDYRDHDKDDQITQFAVANVSIGNFKADFVTSTNPDGTIVVSVVPTPKE
ncbi:MULTISPECIES: restriction endonuclease [Bradyrhizobium]|uniref:restriction endonuclease n=1 Tax=Bradyrhizobium TaxID=374 RepID=UPI001EDC288B|nr:restriction endonuclease [Bradyrhizobium zhengyangense]MCG2639410.1 restriction endonuclease [Bradyrhizobium zhengyangense]